MAGWLLFVDLVRALVFAAAHLLGNSLGGGILAVSVLVRLALLPLTLRAARRAIAHQAKVAALRPHLAALEQRHRADPARLAEATAALYREEGIGLLPSGTVGAALVQLPIGAALYRALGAGLGARASFLWIADLTRPDALVAVGAALLAGTAAALAPAAPGTTVSRSAIALSATLTLFFAWRLTASIGLYWLASNGVGAVQSLLLRRVPRTPA